MKFLTIDDNSIDLLIARAAVQKFNSNFEIVTAESADEALYYLKQNINNLPDVIFLDLNMPVKTGWNFLQEYKTLNISGIDIYILTSSVNEAEKILAESDPFITGFLSKPMRIETIEKVSSTIRQTVSK